MCGGGGQGVRGMDERCAGKALFPVALPLLEYSAGADRPLPSGNNGTSF